MKKSIEQFLDYLQFNRRLSPQTIKSYRMRLEIFLRTVKKQPQDLSMDDIELYSRELAKRHSPATQRHYLTTLKIFLDYLFRKKITEESLGEIEMPKVPDKIPTVLTSEQIDDFIDGCKTNRDKAIVSLLYDTGMRLHEILKLKKNEMDYKNHKIVIRGKGNKVRPVFFDSTTEARILKYLEERTDNNSYLFVTSGKEARQIQPTTLQYMVKRVAEYVGLPREVSVHTFRHSMATTLLNNGLDIRIVQELLGHKNISTTQIYTHITNSQLQRYHQEYHRVR